MEATRHSRVSHLDRWIAMDDKMDLIERFTTRFPVLLDGAMGTQLAAEGLEMGGQNNIAHPDDVLSIHKRYSQVGCDILITNTLTMNRIYIETHNVGVDVKEVNLAGARLARAAIGERQSVLGDISSTGQMLEPYGVYSEEQFCGAFREQAEYLAQGDVDGFIIETMLDLREALCAVQACKAVAPLPVFATLAFHTTENGCRTIMGHSAADSARRLVDAGVSGVGANCGELAPNETAIVVATMRDACSVPVIAQPNAGKPQLLGGQTVFAMPPRDFAAGVAKCLEAGATAVGGCCGTTPEHMACVARMIREIGSNKGIEPTP